MTAKQLAHLIDLLLEYATLVATNDTARDEMIRAAKEATTRLLMLINAGDPDTIASDIPF